MYSIQLSDWGLLLKFAGPLSEGDMKEWLDDVHKLVGGFTESFGIIVDVQDAEPQTPTVAEVVANGLETLEAAGMDRAAIIGASTGGSDWQEVAHNMPDRGLRFVAARTSGDAMMEAAAWVKQGVEPGRGPSGEPAASKNG